MLKIRFEYDLPEYDSDIHDPEKTFAFLTYRGVNYAKWVLLKSRGTKNWKVKNQDLDRSFFNAYNYI